MISTESGIRRYRLELDDGRYINSDQHYIVAAVLKYRGIAINITWWYLVYNERRVSALEHKGVGTLLAVALQLQAWCLYFVK